jgi:hypothetical protein
LWLATFSSTLRGGTSTIGVNFRRGGFFLRTNWKQRVVSCSGSGVGDRELV